ncbi:helicase-related protein [Winogradskyella sp. R77965]|uniref:helicase-related protein n=1 Tax=Winogradskyella sp. R77965 TaxID=3093872 RepID=UPI0037DC5B7E
MTNTYTKKTLGETLIQNIKENDKASIIAAYFTIYGFHELKKELSKIDNLKLILSSGLFTYEDRQFFTDLTTDINGDRYEYRFKNQLNIHKIAQECADWVKAKTEIKSTKIPGVIGTNLIHLEGEKLTGINISTSNLSASDLGFAPNDKITMNTVTHDPEVTQQMLNFFNQNWNNEALMSDVKKDVLEQLELAYKDNTPSSVYYFTLYNIFKDYLVDLDEEKIIKTKTGFKDTLVWNKLYKFQKDGVLGTIDKVEKYGGCILADSVGLGKTFQALAVIKYYELRNDRVLVLCPKKLRDNWTVYTLNDKRNILAEDRFNYDVLNHTDLNRERGLSGEINLETINWGNYDLVVIDESHNFRNNNPRRDRETRYGKLMNHIIKAGVKTKVLMLSATPVNNRMNDLKNQVAFITEGQETAFSEFGIDNINHVMKIAQTQFNKWLKNPDDNKNTSELLESLDSRYFKLLDLITIARSRKHIERYYDLKNIGKFPERLLPKNVKSNIDVLDEFSSLQDINRAIRKLNLSAYSPLKYVRPDKQEEYNRSYDLTLESGSVFKQVDREQSLIHLMRVNLLKRMESSINSFGLTLEKLLGKIDILLDKIQNEEDYSDDDLSIEDIDTDDPTLDDFLIGNKVKVLIQDLDLVRWKQDLEEDKSRLSKLSEETKTINADRDAKLIQLKELIHNKINQPLNEGNKKVIIFTAFADTATYLYNDISKWASDQHQINSALVTGSGSNKTTMKGVRTDLNELLTNFSPQSKERNKIYPELTEEIDILIATDCISEGQNLQDCDYLINYDIHWNPVRIIQRFGRIDRLGSTNTQIQLVNFWPNMELDEYINLEARVSGRMVLLDISATGEENVIEDNGEMNDLDYRRKQLQQMQNEVVDLEDVHGGISIMDFTFNDFKMDLMEYLKEHEGILEQTPTGIHAVTKVNIEDLPEGVIFCLKQRKKNKKEEHHNPIDPYFLTYVSSEGELVLSFTQSKKILDVYQKLSSSETEVFVDLVNDFKKETKQGKDMSDYVELLESAVQEIVGKNEEKGIASLFTTGGTASLNEEIRSLDDFEVISYLVIKN